MDVFRQNEEQDSDNNNNNNNNNNNDNKDFGYEKEYSGRGIKWKPVNSSFFVPISKTKTASSLCKIRDQMKDRNINFVPYDMQGAQSATTTVSANGVRRNYKTTDNMHSEMCAIEDMFDRTQWTLYLGLVIWTGTANLVTANQFTTSEPHCGFCTIMLEVLGLPHSNPSCGNYNSASNFVYPLPKAIREDVFVLARLLDENRHCGFNKIKAILNDLLNIPKDKWLLQISEDVVVNESHYELEKKDKQILDWKDVVTHANGTTLKQIWKMVFEAMFNTNKNYKI